jgi:hypothetical protein
MAGIALPFGPVNYGALGLDLDADDPMEAVTVNEIADGILGSRSS